MSISTDLSLETAPYSHLFSPRLHYRKTFSIKFHASASRSKSPNWWTEGGQFTYSVTISYRTLYRTLYELYFHKRSDCASQKSILNTFYSDHSSRTYYHKKTEYVSQLNLAVYYLKALEHDIVTQQQKMII
jgi:hypothetical protein